MRKFWRRLGRPLLRYGVKIVALLLAVSIAAFLLVCLSPVDPVQQYILGLGSAISPEQRAEIEAYWGVNQPPVERYVHWLGQLLQGNWGESALYRRPVLDIIGERFVNSLALMLCAWVLSGVIGFVLGCLMGMYQGKWPDRLLKKIAYLISSIPTFWLVWCCCWSFPSGSTGSPRDSPPPSASPRIRSPWASGCTIWSCRP